MSLASLRTSTHHLDPPDISLACWMKAGHHLHLLTQQLVLSIYYLPSIVLGGLGRWGVGIAMKEEKMVLE